MYFLLYYLSIWGGSAILLEHAHFCRSVLHFEVQSWPWMTAITASYHDSRPFLWTWSFPPDRSDTFIVTPLHSTVDRQKLGDLRNKCKWANFLELCSLMWFHLDGYLIVPLNNNANTYWQKYYVCLKSQWNYMFIWTIEVNVNSVSVYILTAQWTVFSNLTFHQCVNTNN